MFYLNIRCGSTCLAPLYFFRFDVVRCSLIIVDFYTTLELSFRVVFVEWYWILEEGGRDVLGGGCWIVFVCFDLYISIIEVYKNISLNMAPVGGADPLASPGTSMSKNCPCDMEMSGRSIAWISCKNATCKLSWHATCAGFSRSIKQTLLKSLGEWTCPKCVISSVLPNEQETENNDLLAKFSSKLEEIKEELKHEIKLEKGKLGENVKTYSALVKQNIEQNKQRNVVISKISKELKTVNTNIVNKMESENESRAKERKALNVCIFNIPETRSEDLEEKYIGDLHKVKEILDNKINFQKDDLVEMFRVGRNDDSKTRPLVLKLANKEIKEKLLKLRNLEYRENNEITRIYINPDKTKAEIEEYKKLRKELIERRANGDGSENIGIRGNKIVNLRPFRKDPRSYWDQTEGTRET